MHARLGWLLANAVLVGGVTAGCNAADIGDGSGAGAGDAGGGAAASDAGPGAGPDAMAEPDDPDAGPDPAEQAASDLPAAPGCHKRVRVVLRTNYGMEPFDPARKGKDEYPNTCWLGFVEATGQIENMASRAQGWRSCGLDGCAHDPAGATHWYYDDTSPRHTTDTSAILYAHNFGGNNPGGMKDIKGTVDMARRPDPTTGVSRWKYFQVDASGYPNIIDRWFAETHNPVSDHAGYQYQNNDYIDEWVDFIHQVRDYRIRPQLVIISSDGTNQNCDAAYDQVRKVCGLVGSGRTIGLTMEGGLPWDYGHCEGKVVRALNRCMCSVAGGCF